MNDTVMGRLASALADLEVARMLASDYRVIADLNRLGDQVYTVLENVKEMLLEGEEV